jgi:DNA polymerase-4
MNKKIIFHIDVNSAFLSWEAEYRIRVLKSTLDLRTLPSAVGGDSSKRHGIILAKSIPAKKYGIQTGEPVHQSLKKCPDLLLVPPNHSLYEECSRNLLALLYEFTPEIEPFSIDEAFLNMTGAILPNSNPIETAEFIREKVRAELGFTVNIGISNNKLLAKMASDFQKPDKVHTLFPEEVPLKMWPLPLEELYFVGRSSAKILRGLGLNTIGDIAKLNPKFLKSHLGNKHGELIYQYAHGIDNNTVDIADTPNKGYGNSTTLSKDIDNMEAASFILLSLSETVAARLRRNDVKAGCITVEITDCDFNKSSHQTTLLSSTNATNKIHEIAIMLLKEFWKGIPIRLLGIRATKLSSEDYTQLNLFDMVNYEKQEKLDQALDAIRNRFGKDSVKRASFLETDDTD